MHSEIVDLSILIENNMIYYPGDPEPKLSKYITLEKDELSVRRFKIYQKRCISALAQKYTDFYFELLPEIELDPGELEEIVKEAVDGEGLRG